MRGGASGGGFYCASGGLAPEAETSLRECAEDLVRRAAECGMGGAGALLSMTPKEIEAEMIAHAARRRQAAEDMDLLAWLTGRYQLLAVHAPKRFPRRPDAVARPPKRMEASEIKRAFLAMAAGRRAEDGDC